MDVEPGTVDDAAAVADLWVSLATEQAQYGSQIDPEASRPSVRESAARHAVDDTLLVVRDTAPGADGDDAPIVAFVTFSIQDHEGNTAGRRGVVENLYVEPGHRDEGVGGALLVAAERRLADSGVERVTLEALADNEDARRFYRRHGYDLHRVQLAKRVESDNHSKEGG